MRTILIIVSAVMCLGTAGAQSPQKGSTRPGDVHIYTIQQKTERKQFEEAVTVKGIEGGQIHTVHKRAGRDQDTQGIYNQDWSTVLSGASGSRFDPPLQLVPLPLEAGKSWEQTSQVIAPTGARSQIKTQASVVGLEKLVTPAGTFDAWRIESTSYLSGLSWQGGFQIQQKVWYAPAIDRLVRMEYRESRALGTDTVTELKSFSSAP